MIINLYDTGITESKKEEYRKNQVKYTVPPTTAKNKTYRLKVGNPRAAVMPTDQPKKDGRTVHNPNKPEEPSDTKTNKESQQSGNPASSGTSGNRLHINIHSKKINKIYIFLFYWYKQMLI